MSLRCALWLAAPLAMAQPAAAQDFGADCTPPDLAALAGWGGVWSAEHSDAAAQGLSGRQGGASAPLLGMGAPWNQAGRERMAAMFQWITQQGVETPGWGFPMMMYSYSEFTFVVAPASTAMINQYSEVRQIYTDGRGHLDEDVRWPTTWGDSVGCWQGDTLVIDTVSARYDPHYNPYAPPLSDNARFTERLRLIEPGRMQYNITVTDPDLLTEPWSLELYYVDAGIDRVVLDSFVDRNDSENGTITAAPEGLVPVALPPIVAMSEAELDRFVGTYQLADMPGVMQVVRQGDRLLFAMPPGQPDLASLYPESPTHFASLTGVALDFAVVADGRATGFTGTLSGTRIAD